MNNICFKRILNMQWKKISIKITQDINESNNNKKKKKDNI